MSRKKEHRKCSVDRCRKRFHARGFCKSHYYSKKNPRFLESLSRRPRCKKRGCTEHRHGGGLCQKHYHAKNKKARNAVQRQYYRTQRGRFHYARSVAKYKGLAWRLSKKHYAELTGKSCFYCEGPLPEVGVGLDRVNNKKGYVRGNCLPCCAQCNTMRNVFLTVDEMVVVARALKRYRSRKKKAA